MPALLIGERIQLMDQPLGVYPAQRVRTDGELAGLVAQHHGAAQEAVRLDAAP